MLNEALKSRFNLFSEGELLRLEIGSPERDVSRSREAARDETISPCRKSPSSHCLKLALQE